MSAYSLMTIGRALIPQRGLQRSGPLVCAQFLDRTGARPTDDYVSGAKQIEKR